MLEYQELKTELLQINDRILSVLAAINSMLGTAQQSFNDWINVCQSIENQLSEEIVRVAVVGAIKSGKSTLINSLFAGDYLKRGAGVVTAMVTRIRRGNRLKATLFFKSLKEINADIERSLVLFPSLEWKSNNEKFEIQRDSDRKALQQMIGSLERKQLISNDTRNLSSLYLMYYVKEYDRVKHFLESGNLKHEFYQDFSSHRDFSGNEVLAIYLKDILLEIDSGEIDKNLEIADCQGSDSPNPLHMTMIQDYLVSANFLIYVISSRTGIRQADINFMSMIKKMGLIDHMLFVINVDLNEHQSVDDLEQIIEKVREDISLIKKDPEVFAYSALMSLFKKQRESIPLREKDRLLQWERDREISLFSDVQESAFLRKLKQVVTKHRHELLLMNHLDRLKMIQEGIHQWVLLNQSVLAKGVEDVSLLLKKVKSRQKKVARLKSLVRSTLDGAIGHIKKILRADVDRFFDIRSGEVVPILIEHVQNISLPTYKYEGQLSFSGFAQALYIIYQDFTHEIDAFMAGDINPRIFNFIKTIEDKITEYFDSITGSYEGMAHDTFLEYNSAMAALGLASPLEYQKNKIQIDLKELKRKTKLDLPPASATMHYSTAIKTEAMARWGFYNFIMKVKRFIRRPAKDKVENAHAALKDAVSRMKKETESSLMFNFKNYNENIKFQYIFKLVDIVADHVFAMISERFHDYSKDLSELVDLTTTKQIDKEQMVAFLNEIKAKTRPIAEGIENFQKKVNHLSNPVIS